MGVKVPLLTLTLLPILLCPRGNAQDLTDLLQAPIAPPSESIAQVIPPGLRPAPSDLRPSEQPEPEELPRLPPPEDLLEPSPAPSLPETPLTPEPEETIEVRGYTIVGSTVFSPEELAAVTQPFTGSVSFAQLLQARSAVTQLYIDQGYITSGAFLPEQTLENGQVTIQVIELKGAYRKLISTA